MLRRSGTTTKLTPGSDVATKLYVIVQWEDSLRAHGPYYAERLGWLDGWADNRDVASSFTSQKSASVVCDRLRQVGWPHCEVRPR
jgi:hypothetical protein